MENSVRQGVSDTTDENGGTALDEDSSVVEESIAVMEFWDEGQYVDEEQWQEGMDVLAEEKGRRDTTAGAAQSWDTA